MPRLVVFATVLLTGFLGRSLQSSHPPARIDFVRDVQPIFQQHCYECHGPDQQMNGFRLDRRTDAFRGGTIPVITPGSAQSSRLYLRLVGTQYGRQMPVDDHLEPDAIETIRSWIDQGADWPDAASGDVPFRPLDPAAVTAFSALRSGNRAAFLNAVRGNPRLSTLRGPGGATPLMMAALYGDAALVKALLDAGAAPNVQDDAGATALMWAVTDLDKTRLLLDRGADVKARSNAGRSPIVIAAGIRGNRDVLALLLDRGANPSAKAPGLVANVTPLSLAAGLGDAEMLRLLVERGANVPAAGFLPVALAMRQQCGACLDVLLPGMPPEIFTPIMALAAPPLGPALAVPMLLERGADPNSIAPNGYPVLLLAAASAAQPVDAIKALLARGADLRARGPHGETALQLARRHGATPVVEALMQAGAPDAAVGLPAMTPSPAHDAREAVARSLPLLQSTAATFMRKSGCVSCHNNSLTGATVALARQRGVALNDAMAREQRERIAAYLEDWRPRVLQGQGIPGDHDTISEILVGLAAEGYAPDPATDAMARFVLAQQSVDGRWMVFAHRPPLEVGDIKETAIAIRALQVYAPRIQRDAADEAIRRAAAWLSHAPIDDTTQEHVYLLFGRHWTGADEQAVAAAARGLLALQRADGGWAQTPTLPSDAYATGEALSALGESGTVAVTDPAFRRGVQYLLKTQLADGSWLVRTRAIAIQPYFDAGFPHGTDQFISAAATNWATTALLRSMKGQ